MWPIFVDKKLTVCSNFCLFIQITYKDCCLLFPKDESQGFLQTVDFSNYPSEFTVIISTVISR